MLCLPLIDKSKLQIDFRVVFNANSQRYCGSSFSKVLVLLKIVIVKGMFYDCVKNA